MARPDVRVFIPSKGRQETISSHAVFDGVDYTVVVHNEEQAEIYQNRVPREHLVVSGVIGDTFGLTRQREWICEHLARPGEWFVFADDNIKALTGVHDDYYAYRELPVEKPGWRARYDTTLSATQFTQRAEEMIDIAQGQGFHLCGFATTANHYFRGRKWGLWGYVIGKLMLWHNVGVPFDHTISMEDFNNTAENLFRFGGVLINRFIWPQAGHYEPGGMGTFEQRADVRKRDCERLMKKWPGLFACKSRKGRASCTDLQIRAMSEDTIKRWRLAMMVKHGRPLGWRI